MKKALLLISIIVLLCLSVVATDGIGYSLEDFNAICVNQNRGSFIEATTINYICFKTMNNGVREYYVFIIYNSSTEMDVNYIIPNSGGMGFSSTPSVIHNNRFFKVDENGITLLDWNNSVSGSGATIYFQGYDGSNPNTITLDDIYSDKLITNNNSVTGTIHTLNKESFFQLPLSEVQKVAVGNLTADFSETLETLLPVALVVFCLLLGVLLVKRLVTFFL